MKLTSPRMPLRLRSALLAMLVTALATQVSGASAANRIGGPPPMATVGVATAGAATLAQPGEHAAPAALASLLPGPPASGGWELLIAGLIGAWAIGHRRMSGLGSRSLDPRRRSRRR